RSNSNMRKGHEDQPEESPRVCVTLHASCSCITNEFFLRNRHNVLWNHAQAAAAPCIEPDHPLLGQAGVRFVCKNFTSNHPSLRHDEEPQWMLHLSLQRRDQKMC